MASRKRMMWTHVAMVATLMVSAPSLSERSKIEARQNSATSAQLPRNRRRRPPRDASEYTPEAGAKDLKSVLFNWAWHMGMLRSTEEYDLIMSLVYEGTGTIQVGGQPCNVTK